MNKFKSYFHLLILYTLFISSVTTAENLTAGISNDSLKQKYPLIYNENIIWGASLSNFIFINDSSIFTRNYTYRNDSAFIEEGNSGKIYIDKESLKSMKAEDSIFTADTKEAYQENSSKNLKGNETRFSNFLFNTALSGNSNIYKNISEENNGIGCIGSRFTSSEVNNILCYYDTVSDYAKLHPEADDTLNYESEADDYLNPEVIVHKSQIQALNCPLELYFNAGTNEIISKVNCIIPAQEKLTESGSDIALFSSMFCMAVNTMGVKKNSTVDINDPDIIWAKRTKKIFCLPSYYSNDNLNSNVSEIKKIFNKTIVDILFEKVKSREMAAYNPNGEIINDIDDFLSYSDTSQVEDTSPINGKFGSHIEIYKNSIDPHQLFHFYLLQDWFFNKKTMTMETTILGIAPVSEEYNSEGAVLKNNSELFWVYFNGYKP